MKVSGLKQVALETAAGLGAWLIFTLMGGLAFDIDAWKIATDGAYCAGSAAPSPRKRLLCTLDVEAWDYGECAVLFPAPSPTASAVSACRRPD